jgi:aspartate/methionine/tyrosine aminotransferase
VLSERGAIRREPNALTIALARSAAAGRTPIDLTISNPTDAAFPVLSDPAWVERTVARSTRYDPAPFGIPLARDAIAAWMAAQAMPVPANHVVVTASTSEAYALLFKLLCDPGDEVLVPAPSYPLLDHLCRLEAVTTQAYPLRYDGRWHLSVGEIAERVGPRTRAVVLVSPNNPTGSFTKRDELERLAALGLPIVSDEVFGAYPLRDDPARSTSAVASANVLSFSLFGLSKLAALPQHKLSWLAVGGPPREVEEALARLEIIADAFLSVATPIQLALPAILSGHRAVTDAIGARLHENLAALRSAVAGTPIDLLDVEGGWYATLRLPATRDDEAWALDLLEHAGVLVQPGYFYDFAGGPHVVLSLLTPPDALTEGSKRLVRHVTESA